MAVFEIEKSGGIATPTLNRPEAQSALNAELRASIERAFTELRDDASTAREHLQRVTPEAVAARRAGIQQRGRSQRGGSARR